MAQTLERRKNTYVCAVARVALSSRGETYKVVFGRVDFLGKKDKIPNELDLDYGNFRLVRFPLDLKQASTLAQELVENGRWRIRNADVPIIGSFNSIGLRYVASQQSYALIRPMWPSVLYYFQLEREAVGDVTQQPLVRLNLPFYPSGREAVGEFCDVEINGGFPQSQILFVLPDFRARIRTMKISEGNLLVDVEAPEELEENLRAKFYIESDDRSSRSEDLTLSNGSAQFTFEGDLKLAIIYLLSATTGDDIDNRVFSPWYDRRRAGIVIEASELRVRELIRAGEGPRIEFKEELPSDEHRLLDSIVAFANTNGGTILLGVKDDGEIVGIQKNLEDVKQTITNWISDKCDPPPQIELHQVQVNEKIVLVVDVAEGPNKPYQDIDRGFLVRRGASNRQGRRSEIGQMFSGQYVARYA